MGEDSFRGKKIEEYDSKNNRYTPYFGSEVEFEAFKAMKLKGKGFEGDLGQETKNA